MPKHQLVVIGAGPGGYVAAIKAAQLGLDVACVEKEQALGGTCLRVGCIPSKALLDASEKIYAAQHNQIIGAKIGQVELDLAALMAHKDKVVKANTGGVEYLFKKNKVTRYLGHGTILTPNKVRVEGPEGVQELETERILIATGSKVAPLKGVQLDYEIVGTSDQAIAYPSVPERLVVIGGGVIGLELGSVWNRLGAKVTVLEYLPHILGGMDSEVARAAEKIFKKQGLDIRTGVRVTAAYARDGKGVVEYEGGEPLVADRVLLATGRIPNTDGLGLENVGLRTDERGRIPVNAHYQTAVPNIFAIGDVIAGPMLAHKAEEEGYAAVEYMVTGYGHVDYNAIPNVVYTHPEIASVGKTEEELKSAGIPYKKGSFPFSANGRARAMNDTDGFAKILAHAETDRILGVHIIGPRAGDLIAEAAVAIAFHASSEDLARASHAHPTLAEVLKEAALATWDKPLHI
ncbi:dihydrolipoyl dehydrogenase [Meiothermus ruber]|jgi:dihydrolipoamide dehydrogenase|uniref:Dihydrolipoyl dehydrogenase n=1 Tax=Meiothermus ruber (strain ATCC 35948 / DSM 1279 / VKM B-1258 / 21) TaxID=504728 RepID=D3PS61_MEIRD|nr:dihydrolipoyl dehydrogenase [Meiothermus ruber]ADD28294.1 dihydrolipoamide dehydrogenase [Meiothermus ruber DSM 1279]AGK06266.1 dihydrolipoamide dehydrogenase [Meiothermus ruber DSM 1279]MCL6529102.1 dihydrolipoyl dehydrogenase [Meiothermus ruber]GAO75248.1 dihydrolipoamide dehydrogenase [Meiothermus ruber H328]